MSNEIRVLIAEDDTNTHEEWGESLAAWGFRSEIADDGVKALELISSFNPHILVSDLRMPRKNGLELLRDIRELGIHLPAIMISGQGEIPDAVEALKLGAIDANVGQRSYLAVLGGFDVPRYMGSRATFSPAAANNLKLPQKPRIATAAKT